MNFSFIIDNLTIINCYFKETAQIINFPINNINFIATHIVVKDSIFGAQSSIITSAAILAYP